MFITHACFNCRRALGMQQDQFLECHVTAPIVWPDSLNFLARLRPPRALNFPLILSHFHFLQFPCCCWLCIVYNFVYLRRASTHYANSHDSIDYSLLPPLINLLAILPSHHPAQGYCNFRQNRLAITTQKAKKEIYSCI